MNLFDRFILFLYSLALTVISVFMIILSLRVIPYQQVEQTIHQIYQSNQLGVSFLLASAIFLIISLRFLALGFRRKKPAPSLSQQGEFGEVQISFDTVENITSQTAKKVKGVKDLQVKVHPLESGAMIKLKVFVDGEIPIPELTEKIQKNVKYEVEKIVGIELEQVTVVVAGVTRAQVTQARVK